VRTSERRQLKQDKFAETTKETLSWAVAHRKKLVAGIIVVVVVVVAVAAGLWVWNYRSQQANTALGRALTVYNAPIVPVGTAVPSGMVVFNSAQERARAARTELQKVANQYSSTTAGHMAEYLAAVSAINMGDLKVGEQELKSLADSSNADISSLAKLSLAGVYRATNRNNDALQIYKSLVEHPTGTVSKATAQLELASLYDATNQKSEAGKLYSEIMKDDPRSFAAGVANQKLSSPK